MNHQDVKAIFSKAGIRYTKPRKLVFDLLNERELPVTVEHLYLELKGRDASISLSTVYRILEVFVEKELVIKSNHSDDNKALYELNRMAHRHRLMCLGCHKMMLIDGCPLEGYDKLLEKKTQFRITGHRLEIQGYCEECDGRHS